MRKNLGITWAMKRELEIRARRPASYRGFEYAGLGMPALWVTMPMVGIATAGGLVSPILLTLALAPHAIYLVVGAAGTVAGSLNVDRRVAGRLPVSAASHLIGKLAGSLLTLWGEIIMLAPLLLVGSVVATASTRLGTHLVAMLTWLVLLGGLLGAASCNRFVSARDAARQARTRAWLLLIAYPCLVGLVLLCSYDVNARGLGWAGHAVLPALVLHPVTALALLGVEDHLDDVARGMPMAILVAAVLFVAALRKVRAMMR